MSSKFANDAKNGDVHGHARDLVARKFIIVRESPHQFIDLLRTLFFNLDLRHLKCELCFISFTHLDQEGMHESRVRAKRIQNKWFAIPRKIFGSSKFEKLYLTFFSVPAQLRDLFVNNVLSDRAAPFHARRETRFRAVYNPVKLFKSALLHSPGRTGGFRQTLSIQLLRFSTLHLFGGENKRRLNKKKILVRLITTSSQTAYITASNATGSTKIPYAGSTIHRKFFFPSFFFSFPFSTIEIITMM